MKFNSKNTWIYLSKNYFISILFCILASKLIGSTFVGIDNLKKITLDDLNNYYGSQYKNLLNWVSTTDYPLFVIPPWDNSNRFEAFRFLSKRSIWGAVPDVNQLHYSPKYYTQNFERLKVLGFEFLSKRKFRFRYEPCYLSLRSEIKNKPIILFKEKFDCLDKFKVLFENDDYIVLILK